VFASAGCVGCHTFAAAGAAGAIGPSLDASTLDEAAVAAVVANGRGGMQGFADELSAQEIADVAAYVTLERAG